MIDCIADIERWCRSHGLNSQRRQIRRYLAWYTRQQLAISQADKDLHLPSGTLRASETARNLWVIIQQLTFDAHARACSRACSSAAYQTDQTIDERPLRLLVHAFVTSRQAFSHATKLHHCFAGYTGYQYKLCVLMFDVFHRTRLRLSI